MSYGEDVINGLTEKIIGSAYKVGSVLGAGFLEKVYEKAMCHELSKQGLSVAVQYPLKVHYDGIVVGDYFVDLFIDNSVVVELKAVSSIDKSHLAQCLNYLKATDTRIGLIINFGSDRVQVKRVVNNF